MIRIGIKKHILQFKSPAGTSRGVLNTKPSWFITIEDTANPRKVGYGEASIIPGLSFDDRQDFENKITVLISTPFSDIKLLRQYIQGPELTKWPAIRFGLETAMIDFDNPGKSMLFPSDFTHGRAGIPINGLIWMGKKSFMYEQIREKLEEGWYCIKIKIGAINFEDEMALISFIRKQFSATELMIRVDANGAFTAGEAMDKLKRLSEFELHSIEQPIKAGQYEAMARLCEKTPLPIALDEELIGIFKTEEKTKLLQQIKPQFIILKPSLLGGISSSEEWIEIAESNGIDFWITSALESNIGLNAIAQWTAFKRFKGYQGLGTGQLFTNNIPSPLVIKPGYLHYESKNYWNYHFLKG